MKAAGAGTNKSKPTKKTGAAKKPAARRKKNRHGGLLGRLVRACLIIGALGVFAAGYLFWQITHYSPPNPVPKRQAGIVLGAALWNDAPSPGLKERLDQALKLYHAGRVEKLIVSGGLDRNGSKLTEAQGMRVYLVSRGVPKDAVILENRATSTYENLVFSRQAGEAAGIKSYLIITHEYHASRALDMARFLGFPDPAVSSVKSKVLNAAANETRETLAYGKWQLDKLLMLVGLKSV
ncbi:YdcF family protein [Paenibacillus sp. D51F]